MIRLIFMFILVVHGLIHLLGFLKEWRLADMSQLTGKTLFPLPPGVSKAAGVLWLVTCILFIAATVSYISRNEWWWLLAAIAVVISQILIIIYWNDAKFGTIANAVILTACVLAYGSWSFQKMVTDELNSFAQKATYDRKVVTEEMISNLPFAVKKWMARARIIGRDVVHTVHLKQKGEMRTEPEGSWMPVEAEQFIRVNNPGFIWIADVQAAPFIHLTGRDKYVEGRGYMLIKLLSLFTVADAKGNETDQGALLRHLAEIVWYPSAALNDYIKWEEIDSTTAKATMSYGGLSASGTFGFDDDGDVASFEAQRYFDRKEGPTLETWFISIAKESYREFESVRIPAKSSVTWKLDNGDFTWFKLEITDIAYNKRKLLRY